MAAISDSYFILPDVVVASTSNYAIRSNFNDTFVQVDGSAFGVTCIRMGAIDSTLRIGEMGSVSGASSSSTTGSGVVIAGARGALINDGQITANQAIAVLSSSTDFSMVNNGSISGASGVFLGLFGVAGNSLVNSGNISASTYDDATNGVRYNNAVYSEGRETLITNLASGVLTAVSADGAGIRLGNGTEFIDVSIVNNYGTVTSSHGVGVVFDGMSNDFVTLNNYGTISGFGNSFFATSNRSFVNNYGTMQGSMAFGVDDDSIVNEGSIRGHVFVSNGDDHLVNRGSVTGSVIFGAGSDTLTFDGGSIEGGATMGSGDDRVQMLHMDIGETLTITGNAGADMFDLAQFASAVWVDLDYAGFNVWTRDNNAVSSGNWRAIANLSSIENLTGTDGVDVLRGNSSENVFTYVGSQAIGGVDRYDGRDGSDTVDFEAFDAAIWIDLNYASSNAWTRDADDLSSGDWRGIATTLNFENVIGTTYVDEMYGTAGDNTFNYRGSSQYTGVEIVDGRGGVDTLDMSRFIGAVWIDLTAAIEVATQDHSGLSGGTWRNVANLTSIENITGSNYLDELRGDAGANVLNGGRGSDLLIGRGGLDTFVFVDSVHGFGVDEIRGFDANNGERIDLSQVAEITDYADLSANHLMNVGGTAHIVIDGNNTIILTGWAVADFGVAAGITADDFIF